MAPATRASGRRTAAEQQEQQQQQQPPSGAGRQSQLDVLAEASRPERELWAASKLQRFIDCHRTQACLCVAKGLAWRLAGRPAWAQWSTRTSPERLVQDKGGPGFFSRRSSRASSAQDNAHHSVFHMSCRSRALWLQSRSTPCARVRPASQAIRTRWRKGEASRQAPWRSSSVEQLGPTAPRTAGRPATPRPPLTPALPAAPSRTAGAQGAGALA